MDRGGNGQELIAAQRKFGLVLGLGLGYDKPTTKVRAWQPLFCLPGQYSKFPFVSCIQEKRYLWMQRLKWLFFFLVSLGADFNQFFFFFLPFSPFTAPFLKKRNSSERNWSCSQDKWA